MIGLCTFCSEGFSRGLWGLAEAVFKTIIIPKMSQFFNMTFYSFIFKVVLLFVLFVLKAYMCVGGMGCEGHC